LRISRSATQTSAVTLADASATYLVPAIVDMIRELTGGAGLPAEITADSLLEADLQLESIEVAALADRLRERFGVDLPAFLAGLELDQLIDLTIGGVASHVAEAGDVPGHVPEAGDVPGHMGGVRAPRDIEAGA
jgi:acyl carrier protein